MDRYREKGLPHCFRQKASPTFSPSELDFITPHQRKDFFHSNTKDGSRRQKGKEYQRKPLQKRRYLIRVFCGFMYRCVFVERKRVSVIFLTLLPVLTAVPHYFGKITVNTVCSVLLVTSNSPLCAVTISLAMASPKPAPPVALDLELSRR